MNSDDRIRELEAKVAELTALVSRATGDAGAPGTGSESGPAPTSSRRTMLRLAGAAAVGSAVAIAGKAGPAAADDPNDLTLGAQKTTAGLTRADVIAAGGGAGFLFQAGGVWDNSNSSYPCALAGWSTVDNRPHGVYGYTSADGGHALIGLSEGAGGYGAVLAGSRADAMLVPGGSAPSLGGEQHTAGELTVDGSNNLWLCVAAGAPGTWRKIGGPNSAGSFHAVTPGRVYDSRAALPIQGSLVKDAHRTVSVKDRRDSVTGAVVQADFVPAGATAVTANITVVNTLLSGFLTVNPGGVVNQDTAAINWSGSGQILNNGTTFTLNSSREISVICGGIAGASTHFVIDVTGYFL